MAARYDRADGKIVVSLDTGVELSVPANLVQGLSEADAGDLEEIELTPTGLGLHWPRLDADLYVPGLLASRLGSKAWMTRAVAARDSRDPSANDPVLAKRAAARGA